MMPIVPQNHSMPSYPLLGDIDFSRNRSISEGVAISFDDELSPIPEISAEPRPSMKQDPTMMLELIAPENNENIKIEQNDNTSFSKILALVEEDNTDLDKPRNIKK